MSLPLLQRVEDFKWGSDAATDTEPVPAVMNTSPLSDIALDDTTAVIDITSEPAALAVDAESVGSLRLHLETLAHLTDLASLCSPTRHSWKNYLASPLVYFVGTLYLAEVCLFS